MESEPEDVTLALGEKELLPEGHCEGVCVAQGVALLLCVLLLQCETEGKADAVPRWPRAAAPPVALILEVPHPLKEEEVVGDVEGDPEAEKLALAE